VTFRVSAPVVVLLFVPSTASAQVADDAVQRSISKGLTFLATEQAPDGRWEADGGSYRVAMTALAGMAFLMNGDTPTQGRYADRVDRAVRYILSQVQPTGLIGRPETDPRYMYGHGFAMLFLSQTIGEDSDPQRREQIMRVLEKAVIFSGQAQTSDGGWGYTTAAEGFGFDEGSVTITQMQGLRSCRNAGVPVPKQIVDKGVKYIERCTTPSGVRYSLKTEGGARPPLSAAAVACLFNAGEYGHPTAAKLKAIADAHFSEGKSEGGVLGHWHYAHYYYSQVAYRGDPEHWKKYKQKVYRMLLDQQEPSGAWTQGWVGPIYTTALNLAILQLDGAALPIYQR